MITKRIDRDNYTEIAVMRDDGIPPWDTYRIFCMDVDIDPKTDRRTPPTARISLLSTTQADVEQVRRLAAEYEYVADVAERLQAEKRAAFGE